MPVTVKVNGVANSLVHKGSNGISVATIPDVCKTPTPGGPVPIPYPNVSQSATLAKGTSTVTADGGMMVAIKGSEFSLSNGDNAGVVGGVKSGTFMKESTWITYSFDVKMDGQNACRLTDKKFQNHENTVDLAGEMQAPASVAQGAGEVFILCKLMCDCIASGNPHQKCVSDKLDAADNVLGGKSPIKAEVPFDMRQMPPKPMPEPWAGTAYQAVRIGVKGGTTPGGFARRTFPDLGAVLKGQIRIPDVALVNNPALPPSGSNLAALVEMKMPGDKSFNDPGVRAQIADYARIALGNNPSAPVLELDAKSCGCDGTNDPVLAPDLQKQEERLKKRVRVPAPVAERAPWHIPLPSPGVVAGLALVGLGIAAWATGVGAPLGSAALASGLVLLIGGVPATPAAFKA